MKSTPLQSDIMRWTAIGVGGLVVLYVVVKYVLPAIGKATANSVANAPGAIVTALGTGADNLISAITTPFTNWYNGTTAAPASATSTLSAPLASNYGTQQFAGSVYNQWDGWTQVTGMNDGATYAVNAKGQVLNAAGQAVGVYP